MFKKNLVSILGSFTKVNDELIQFVSEGRDKMVSLDIKIGGLRETRETVNADINKARAISNNISTLLETQS